MRKTIYRRSSQEPGIEMKGASAARRIQQMRRQRPSAEMFRRSETNKEMTLICCSSRSEERQIAASRPNQNRSLHRNRFIQLDEKTSAVIFKG